MIGRHATLLVHQQNDVDVELGPVEELGGGLALLVDVVDLYGVEHRFYGQYATVWDGIVMKVADSLVESVWVQVMLDGRPVLQ